MRLSKRQLRNLILEFRDDIPDLNQWLHGVRSDAKKRGVTGLHVAASHPDHPMGGGSLHYADDHDDTPIQGLRDYMIDWESERGYDPEHDWRDEDPFHETFINDPFHETFTNELDNEIELRIEEASDDASQAEGSLTISLTGPESETGWTITRMEAHRLHDMLMRYLEVNVEEM